MKIIKKGRPKDWWVGREVTCRCCEARIELEKGDEVHTAYDRNNSALAAFQCPHCNEQVWVYPSDI